MKLSRRTAAVVSLLVQLIDELTKMLLPGVLTYYGHVIWTLSHKWYTDVLAIAMMLTALLLLYRVLVFFSKLAIGIRLILHPELIDQEV